ncbi:hypothetical protein SCLARK_00796 [Spiroplasma clarkii]|uniref:hypothetical protein n=1 Tax=Spiroplasma clarkii TaxID=2139 RepID=UPI000B5724D8|nr:hypothetical protein [Spiroplasma clarkii]ARU91427.1 hypothetical protein SCLARK_00796 [Spiroplasma clarkii]
MIINIGPWWLYDIFAFLIIIGGLYFGLKRGFLVTLYVLGVQIVALVINLFIPTLLTNAINPPIVALIKKTGLVDILNFAASSIGSVFMNLLKSLIGDSDFAFSWDGMGEELLKVFTAAVIFVIFSVIIVVVVNVIGIAIYHTVLKERIRRIKIIGPADMILGAFNGLAFGLMFSLYLSSFISLPIFATETQKLSLFNYSQLTAEQKEDWAKYGNSYSRYSLSKKVAFNMPTVPLAKYMYTNACVQKYLINPASSLVTQFVSQGQTGNVFTEIPATVFDTYAELMLDGYVANNPLNAPLATCIQIMPDDTRTLLRTVAEIMLVTPRSLLVSDGTNVADVQTNVNSIQIMNAFEQFRAANELEVDYEKPNTFMTLDNFKKFYAWADTNNVVNPFIQVANFFDDSFASLGYNSDKN